MAKKILVFSKEEGIREAVKLILNDHYEMILTDSLELCEDIISKTEISTLCLDIDKNDDINQNIQKLKTKEPTIKIVALGGYKSEDSIKEAVNSGADSYILKPFKADELMTIIN